VEAQCDGEGADCVIVRLGAVRQPDEDGVDDDARLLRRENTATHMVEMLHRRRTGTAGLRSTPQHQPDDHLGAIALTNSNVYQRGRAHQGVRRDSSIQALQSKRLLVELISARCNLGVNVAGVTLQTHEPTCDRGPASWHQLRWHAEPLQQAWQQSVRHARVDINPAYKAGNRQTCMGVVKEDGVGGAAPEPPM
jgi:hypothetical protein